MLDSFPSNDGLFNYNSVAKIFPHVGEVGCPKLPSRGHIRLSPRAKPLLNPNMPPFELQLVDIFNGMPNLSNQPTHKAPPLGLCSEPG